MSKLGHLRYLRIEETYMESTNHLTCNVHVLVREKSSNQLDILDVDPRDVIDFANTHRSGIEKRVRIATRDKAKGRSFSIYWSLSLLQVVS